jgi:nucleotide-binding universal stress UspA family protein
MKTTVAETDRAAIKSKGREVSGAPIASDLQASISVKNILVPLDFSRASMQALDYATALAEQFKAQIHLVHVQMPDEACAVSGAGHLMRECAESVTFLHEKLAGIKTERRPQFWPENCHVRSGHAYKEICDLARKLNIDLVVLASRGNTGLKRLVLGSTAERVARFSPCPVLVVRERKRKGNVDLGLVTSGKKFRIRKILAPVDFSQCSMAGAMYAAFLSKTFGAKLCLFHAFQPPPPVVVDRVSASLSSTDGLNLKNARLDMEAFSKLDFLRDVKCAVEIRTGYPIDEICGEAKEPDIDLVVISTHGRSGFDRVLLGSIAEHVVRYAECPVLVVPSRCSTS